MRVNSLFNRKSPKCDSSRATFNLRQLTEPYREDLKGMFKYSLQRTQQLLENQLDMLANISPSVKVCSYHEETMKNKTKTLYTVCVLGRRVL